MWTSAKAPSLAEMEAMADAIFARLPKGFRDLCEGVIIRVDDFPTDEVLDEMEAESEFDLLGLFQGIGLPFRSHDDIARLDGDRIELLLRRRGIAAAREERREQPGGAR